MNHFLTCLFAAAIVFPALPAGAQGGADLPPPREPGDSTPGVSAMHEVSPGVFEVGHLRIEQATRKLIFPGAVNMDKGPLEYLLVAPAGNAHESLLVTSQIEPRDLHLAMLLLGAKGAAANDGGSSDTPPAQLSRDYLEHAPKLAGDPILISVRWKAKDGTEKMVPVEDWLLKTDVRKPAEHGVWIYNGSMFGSSGRFLAQVEGNFAALVTNPAALINNPRKGSDNDQIWEPNQKAMPPAGTPIEIIIQLTDAKEKPASPK